MEEKDETVRSVDPAQEQSDTAANPTTILDLNDDCLTHIFQQLNIVDRIRSERVCKRWHTLLKESWFDVHIIDFDKHPWDFIKLRTSRKFTIKSFKKVLSRCGQYVVFVDSLRSWPRRLEDKNCFSIVAKYCHNLEYFFAEEIKFDLAGLRELAERCSKIVSLGLGDCTDDCDEELALLFWRNRRLRHLQFHSNSKVTGECLTALNVGNIELIGFDNCSSISTERLRILRRFENLKSLKLIRLNHRSGTGTISEEISACFHNLKELILFECTSFPFSPRQMAKLVNIVELDVSKNDWITDDILVAVGNNCKALKEIDLSSCNSITNRGLAGILALPDLEDLSVKMLDGIDDAVFDCAPKLRKLNCRKCVNIKDEGIARLIKNSHEIKCINLIGCRNITNALIRDAIRYTRMRENCEMLTIVLGNCRVKLEEIAESSPLLEVICF